MNRLAMVTTEPILIAQVSDESDRSLATINGILDGTIDCPDSEVIEAFGEVLEIGEDVILQYANMDECEYDDETDDEDDTEDDEMHDDDDEMSAKDDEETETETDAVEVDDEDDEIDNIVMNEAGITELIQKANDGNIKAVRKFYGISGMFEGSFEEIKSLISDKISGYLEYELDLKDEFWIDYEVLCTKLTEILVYSFQKKQVYKIDYTISDKDVEFTAIEAVKLTYEMMESMDDEEKAVILENDELPTPELELSHLTDEEHTTEEQLAD